jgi:metal-responsive CopG/Arc/MetJ family transcriptional regulator
MSVVYVKRMTKPPLESSTRKSVTLPDSLWQELADFRFANRISSEAEAIRRIIRDGLDVNRTKESTDV